MKTIEWTDARSQRNVFVDWPLIYPGPEPMPAHPFEPRRYMDGVRAIVSDICWCHAKIDHPIHKDDDTA